MKISNYLPIALAIFVWVGCKTSSSTSSSNEPRRLSGSTQTGTVDLQKLQLKQEVLVLDLSAVPATGNVTDCWPFFAPDTVIGSLQCGDQEQAIRAEHVTQKCFRVGGEDQRTATQTLVVESCSDAKVYTANFRPQLRITVDR